MMAAIGQLYQRMRRLMNLKQEDVARLVGVRRPTISDWETGQQVIKVENMRAMNKVLRVPDRTAIDLARHGNVPDDIVTELVRMIHRGEDPTVEEAMRSLGYSV